MRNILVIIFSLILMSDSIAQIRGTEWGSSTKDMKDGAYITNINNTIAVFSYNEMFRGEETMVQYAFVNDKLARILINISPKCDLKSYLELVVMIGSKYIDQGDIQYKWFRDTWKGQANHLQHAINMGDVELSKFWKDNPTLSKTLINLVCHEDSGIVLDYGSIKHRDQYNLALMDDF